MTAHAADLASIRRRLQDLESKVMSLSLVPSASPSLPVDKLQLADYAKSAMPLVGDSDEDDEEDEVEQLNITRSDLQEIAAAVRDYLEWSHPQAHMNDGTWTMVSRQARDRLERAVAVAECELRRTANG